MAARGRLKNFLSERIVGTEGKATCRSASCWTLPSLEVEKKVRGRIGAVFRDILNSKHACA